MKILNRRKLLVAGTGLVALLGLSACHVHGHGRDHGYHGASHARGHHYDRGHRDRWRDDRNYHRRGYRH